MGDHLSLCRYRRGVILMVEGGDVTPVSASPPWEFWRPPRIFYGQVVLVHIV